MPALESREREGRHSHVPGLVSPARCSAGLLDRAKFCAVLTRAICEKACGKLPTSRLVDTAPFARFDTSLSGPLRPEALCFGKRISRFDRIRRGKLGRGVSQGEVHRLPGFHRKVAEYLWILTADWSRGSRHRLVWSGDGPQGAVFLAVYPRNTRAISEANQEFAAH